MPAAYFLDTSALIAAYLRRAKGHRWVNDLLEPQASNLAALAGITPAELVAAINQLARGGALRRTTRDVALSAFWRQIESGRFITIAITPSLVRQAADLSSTHPLRGYDTIQLACALSFREDLKQSDAASLAAGDQTFGAPVFLTEDKRLAEAAAAEGFTVDSPLAHP